MDLQNFYSDKRRLSYNPTSRKFAKRSGIRALIAYDDRFDEVVKTLTELIQESDKKIKLLDIGIGDAVYENLLPKEILKKVDIYGIDISQKQLDRSKSILREGKIVDLNSEKLPYRANQFDMVLVSELLEHVFYPDQVLAEAVRVLKKGGKFVLTYPNSGALQLRLALAFTGRSPLLNYPKNQEHIRFFDKNDILDMIGESAILIEYQGLSSCVFDAWNFPFKLFMPRIFEIVGNKIFPSIALGHLMVLTKK